MMFDSLVVGVYSVLIAVGWIYPVLFVACMAIVAIEGRPYEVTKERNVYAYYMSVLLRIITRIIIICSILLAWLR